MTAGTLNILAPIAAIGSFLASAALAAGPEPVSMEPAIVAPVVSGDWSGGYGGLTLGAAFGSSDAALDEYYGETIIRDVEELDLFPPDIEEQGTSAIGGLTLGYNHQRGSFLGGIELDVSALNQENVADFSEYDPSDDIESDTNTTYRTEMSGLATLRFRGGFVQDRNLFYATAGIAVGQVENEFTLALPDFAPYVIDESWSKEGTRHGYVVGAGVERQLTERWSVKGEVMYYDLEDVSVEGTGENLPGFEGNGLAYEFDNDGYIARVGLNFAF